MRGERGRGQLNRFYGIPKLKPGEVICPVCSQPGFIMIPDRKPGIRYQHIGRSVICRALPGAPLKRKNVHGE